MTEESPEAQPIATPIEPNQPKTESTSEEKASEIDLGLVDAFVKNPRITIETPETFSDDTSVLLKNVNKTFTMHDRNIQTFMEKLTYFYKPNKPRRFQALKNIEFELKKGEKLGIVGHNGSGKSTLTRIIAGGLLPDEGGLVYRNGKKMLLNLGIGFSPVLTAKENIYINGLALGMRKKEIDELIGEIIAFTELEDFANTQLKYFSNGMRAKLSFSVAVHSGAEIMIMDEVFAVGDDRFRQKAVAVMERSWLENRTVILVSHSDRNIERYCNKALALEKGEIFAYGTPSEVLKEYNKLMAATSSVVMPPSYLKKMEAPLVAPINAKDFATFNAAAQGATPPANATPPATKRANPEVRGKVTIIHRDRSAGKAKI